MNTMIQKWGNSQGVRLPKIILDELGMAENDRVEITTEKDSIIIKKSNQKKHMNIEERLISFYGKPLDSIYELITEDEIETGNPVGEEVW